MLRKFVCAAIMVVLVGGVAMAESIRGIVTKVTPSKDEDKKGTGTISFYSFKKVDDKFEKGDEMEIKYHKDTKVHVGKKKDEKEDSDMDKFIEAVEAASKGKGKFKGVFTTIDIGDSKDKATSITYRVFKRKKKVDD